MNEFEPILVAAAGGLLPSLAWLWFWLHEDKKHPEPRRWIALAFAAGMLSVAIVIPIEQYVATILQGQTVIFTAWSAIEEITKFLAAALTVLWLSDNDEPIDAVVYMVTVALGFAAVENTLFLLSPLAGSSLLQTFITGNLRFIGATPLHILSSGVIGAALGFSFYKHGRIKAEYVLAGVILAIALHSAFNFLILNTPEEYLFRTFALVWVGVVVLLAALEFIKRLKPRWV
jgi:RsiW-degrading membrane proteinase PrsW (M82 family)